MVSDPRKQSAETQAAEQDRKTLAMEFSRAAVNLAAELRSCIIKGGELEDVNSILERIRALDGVAAQCEPPLRIIDSQDNLGRTALMLAVLEGHADIANVLLHNGADPDIEDYEGQTARDCFEPNSPHIKEFDAKVKEVQGRIGMAKKIVGSKIPTNDLAEALADLKRIEEGGASEPDENAPPAL